MRGISHAAPLLGLYFILAITPAAAVEAVAVKRADASLPGIAGVARR